MILSGEISRMLAERAADVAAMLLPNGKCSSGEWKCGSVDGEKGESLSVRISGDKAGVWSDFATGDGGDLLDLWQAARGVSHVEARAQACDYLGIRLPELHTPQRTYAAPPVPKGTVRLEKSTRALDYLTGQRKLSAEALEAYRVAATSDAVVFPFLVEGERVMVKRLLIDRHNGKKDIRPTGTGQKPVLFGWQALKPTSRSVTICEGEIDAVSLWQYGHPALSVPFGGGAGDKHEWVEHEFERLLQFDEIFLCMDTDEAGEAAVRDLVQRLGNHRCRVVKLPKKDANQCLQDAVPKEQIDRCFQHARRQDPEELKPVEAFREDVLALMYGENTDPGLVLPFQKLHGLKLRPGELSIWNGINGHGKSWFTSQIALEYMRHGERVCVASMEFMPPRYLRRMVEQAAGQGEDGKPSQAYSGQILDWMAGRLWIFAVTGSAKIDRMIQCFEFARKAYGCRFFLVDPLAKCGIDPDDYTAQKAFIERLCDFKNEHDVHVALVTHPRKSRDEMQPPDKMDVGGSGAVTDLADTLVSIWRNKPKEILAEIPPDSRSDEERRAWDKRQHQGDTLLIVQKQRNGEWEGKAGLFHRKGCNQFVGGPEAKPFQYVKFRSEAVA